MRRRQKQTLLLICLFALGLIGTLQRYLYSAFNFVNYGIHFDLSKYKYPLNERMNFDVEKLTLYSKCLCQKEVITLSKKINNNYLIEVSNIPTKNGTQTFSYMISKEYIESYLSCDLYKVLRRGPSQNVVAFSIKENELLKNFNDIYFTNIKQIVNNNYRNWTARVYYDTKQIRQNMVCQYECSNEKRQVDFCDVGLLPLDMSKKWNASFMEPSVRRWLPFGDWFIDIFVSRDYDSCVNDRELSAVKNWIKSKTLFHIMRDHPSHNHQIISGMWGFVSHMNRALSQKLFHLLIENSDSESITLEHFWPIFKENCTIHDSFYCSKKEFGNSQPFPMQRNIPNCFVGQYGCCGSELNKNLKPIECPIQCRPKDNSNNWLFC